MHGRPIDVEPARGRDIGNLLSSLQRMHLSIKSYQVKMTEYQSGLEQKIQQLAESQESLSEAQRLAQLGNRQWQLSDAPPGWSDEMRRIFSGVDKRAAPSLRHFLDCVDPRERIGIVAEFRELRKVPRSFASEHRIVAADGVIRTLFHRGASEADTTGQVARIYGTIQDITERKLAAEQIRRLALYDGLTGLPNRQFFKEVLDHAIARAKRSKENLAALFIDLDRFKREIGRAHV